MRQSLQKLQQFGGLPNIDAVVSQADSFIGSSNAISNLAGASPDAISSGLTSYNASFETFTSSLAAVNQEILNDSANALNASSTNAAPDPDPADPAVRGRDRRRVHRARLVVRAS